MAPVAKSTDVDLAAPLTASVLDIRDDHSCETLTASEKTALTTISEGHGSLLGIAVLVSVRQMFQLEDSGYIRLDEHGTTHVWRLTDVGAEAIGIDASDALN